MKIQPGKLSGRDVLPSESDLNDTTTTLDPFSTMLANMLNMQPVTVEGGDAAVQAQEGDVDDLAAQLTAGLNVGAQLDNSIRNNVAAANQQIQIDAVTGEVMNDGTTDSEAVQQASVKALMMNTTQVETTNSGSASPNDAVKEKTLGAQSGNQVETLLSQIDNLDLKAIETDLKKSRDVMNVNTSDQSNLLNSMENNKSKNNSNNEFFNRDMNKTENTDVKLVANDMNQAQFNQAELMKNNMQSAQLAVGGTVKAVESNVSTSPLSSPNPVQSTADMIEPQVKLEVIQSTTNGAKDESYNVLIKIHPPELGQVLAKLHMDQGNSSLFLLAENNHVKEILENNMLQLREELKQAGIQVNHIQVDINNNASNGGSQFGNQFNEQFSQSNQSNQAYDAELRDKNKPEEPQKRVVKSNNLVDTYA